MEAASSGMIWLLLTQIINALAQISARSTRFPACWTTKVFTTLIFLFLLLAIRCQHPSRNSTSLLTTPFTWQAWISAAHLNRRGKQRVNSSERGPVRRGGPGRAAGVVQRLSLQDLEWLEGLCSLRPAGQAGQRSSNSNTDWNKRKPGSRMKGSCSDCLHHLPTATFSSANMAVDWPAVTFVWVQTSRSWWSRVINNTCFPNAGTFSRTRNLLSFWDSGTAEKRQKWHSIVSGFDFFSTLQITGKYRGLFSVEYRKFISALYSNVLSWAWWFELRRARRSTVFHEGGAGRYNSRCWVTCHMKTTLLFAARRKYRVSNMCTVTKAALQRKETHGGKQDK